MVFQFQISILLSASTGHLEGMWFLAKWTSGVEAETELVT